MVARIKLAEKPNPRLTVPEGTRIRIQERLTRNRGRLASPFVAPAFPPGVGPPAQDSAAGGRLAMEDAVSDTLAWATQLGYISAYQEGLTFPGYAYLSEVAQRPEYRCFAEIISTEMTRKWIRLQAAGDEDKTEQIKELDEEL